MGSTRIGPKHPRRLYLQEHREAKGLTQKQVAERLGVSTLTVSRWERQTGTHKPDTDVLAALAEIYGIEPEDFYHHPSRPSVNALLRDQPDDVVEQAIRLIQAIKKTPPS